MLLFFLPSLTFALNETYVVEVFLNINISYDNLTANTIQSNESMNNAQSNLSHICNISISLQTTQLLYQNNEQVSFQNILSNNSFYYEIDYWIEDLFGREIKKIYTTKNQNTKYYTPKIAVEEKVLIIKNQIKYLNCTNINNNTRSQKILIIKNEPLLDDEVDNSKSASCECDETSIVVTEQFNVLGKINSFYTRVKNFYEEIVVYTNIAGKGVYEVVFFDMCKIKIQNITLDGSKTISFNATAHFGNNKYFLLLRNSDDVLDFQELEIFFEGEEKLNKTTGATQLTFTENKVIFENKSDTPTGKIIYESNSEKTKNKTVYFLLVPFTILFLILIFKKKL